MSSGFSEHRNGPIIANFMVEKLGFSSREEAMTLRNEVFRKYHSTLKGLTVASAEGLLPKPFHQEDLGEYWADAADFATFLKPNATLIETLSKLKKETDLKLVVFTNSPRKYGLKCLDALQIRSFFPDSHVFAVEDVMPACKPEAEAFHKVLSAVGTVPEKSVMFEDSMKNIRVCKSIGMHTVLIDETLGTAGAHGGEAALLGDIADAKDPAVDVAINCIDQLQFALPSLLSGRFVAQSSAWTQNGGASVN
eukprot:TRINITY_DN65866_c0_g1_i1.p1 TRINITY_DN65866_c0_g1~~TRINITY_DN65866_c0_g1_i1.p1  ORF type:complete len:281 (+),score=33.88 TRINITY_DN65866_c0_g1_i1:91-843(+)